MVICLFKFAEYFARLLYLRAIASSFLGWFRATARDLVQFNCGARAFGLRTDCDRAVVGRVAGLVKIIMSQLLLGFCVVRAIFGQGEVLGNNADLIGPPAGHSEFRELDSAGSTPV